MGVTNIYKCDHCNHTYTQFYGYGVTGCGCGKRFCSKECAEKAGFTIDDKTNKRTCGYCRGEIFTKFTDKELLDFAIEMYGETRENLSNQLREMIEDKNNT